MKAEGQFLFEETSYRTINKINIPCNIQNQEFKMEMIVVEGEIQ